MAYDIDIKSQAINLRKRGYSIKEIASKFNIAKSTSSLWCNSIILNYTAQQRLQKRQILGQYKSMLIMRKRREITQHLLKQRVLKEQGKINLTIAYAKLLCSIFFWTEGTKNTSMLNFINSDPKMISVFVNLLRFSFPIDEKKFRVLVHVHEYHNEKKVKKFWSKITGIPISQFYKSYLKPHTGKRIRIGYQGCASIRYYDSKIALELRTIYNTFAENLSLKNLGA